MFVIPSEMGFYRWRYRECSAVRVLQSSSVVDLNDGNALAMRGVISIYSYSEAALYKSKTLITHQAMLRFCGYGFLLLYYEIVPPSGVALVLPEVRHTYHQLIPRRRTCS